VFLDADVLASPMTRTLLIAVATEPGSPFTFRWCPSVEAEAERALRPGQSGVGGLRERFDWGGSVLVPDADEETIGRLRDTSEADRHVLAAAWAAALRVVVSRDVHDFGRGDLEARGMSVAHPDLFLASLATVDLYRGAVELMASRRSRRPNTPEELHAALGAGHPLVFKAMRGAYPGVEALPSTSEPPAEAFRGNRCLVCGKTLSDPESLAVGVGPDCRRKT
jgi:hypothetical protein